VYPTVAIKEWLYSRDELAKTNAAVKELDVTKVIDNTFVKNAQDRKKWGANEHVTRATPSRP